MDVEVKEIARSQSTLATVRINAAKQVAVRRHRDGSFTISLPDNTLSGSYHRHVKEVKPAEGQALLACLLALGI